MESARFGLPLHGSIAHASISYLKDRGEQYKGVALGRGEGYVLLLAIIGRVFIFFTILMYVFTQLLAFECFFARLEMFKKF